jgi:hypothetical protein
MRGRDTLQEMLMHHKIALLELLYPELKLRALKWHRQAPES